MKKQLLLMLCVGVLASDARATAPVSLPEKGAASSVPAARWEEAFVTGNGRLGAMLYGDPEAETLIANHCRLFLPLGSYEKVPHLAAHLPELRRIFRQEDAQTAMTFLMAKAAEQGFPGIINTDPFHPGLFVHVRQPSEGDVRDYVRTEDFQTGEVAVHWRDDRGGFRRRLFVSRSHNVIVFSQTCEQQGQIACDLEFPTPKPVEKVPIGDKGWRAGVTADLLLPHRTMSPESVTFHNIYGRGKGGYDVAVRVVVDGGTTEIVDDRIRVAGANSLLLLVRIVPWKTPLPAEASDAWAYSAENPDFTGRAGRFEAVPDLSESSVVAYQMAEDAVALLPQLVQSLRGLQTDYDQLFVPHRRRHAELFDRVSLDLSGGDDRAKTSEELLAIAVRENRLPAALAEKIYDGGRYMFICSAGELPPNLQGIWTGSWHPAWSGDFTLDTNLQLAIKHAYTAGLGELLQGYFRMIEDFYPEWRINATRTYGCPGYLTNARASNTALLLHWGKWPGIFWTGGCGWLTHFFYDHWQITGDETFLRERTVPLLKEVASFYEGFVILDPQTGRYEFVPSYSPETGAGITSTMDVMVCKDILKSLITACRTLNIEQDSIPKWEAMLKRLPEYRINEDEALAEWIPEGRPERYKHRHLSHLHSCYEALDDLDPERTPNSWKAAQEALRRRIHSGGEVSSHGRVHMGLAAAFLRMPEEAYGRLEAMATGESMYASMMCSHEPNGRIFNCDANGAMPEIVHRMIVQSRPGELDLLPALPKAWPKGEIRGIKARQQITIDRMAWDANRNLLTLCLTSEEDQNVILRVPRAEAIRKMEVTAGRAIVQSSERRSNQRSVGVKAGDTVEVTIGY